MMKIQEKEKTIKPKFVEEIGSKSMSNSMFKNLPIEVLESVLAYLPTRILCRCRLVCKEWNHLISQPSFLVLRTLSPCKASSIFISPKMICKTMPTSVEWQVLDPTEKCSYKLFDSFIMDSYLSKSKNRGLRNLKWKKGWYKYTLAADEELIYTMYLSLDCPRTQMHIVCNPISKSFHKIPELPEFRDLYNRDIVVMSVDKSTKTYKIVTMEMYRDTIKPGSQNIFLYESMTLAWRILCEVPDARFSAYSSIFMKGIFYTLFVDLFSIPIGPTSYKVVLYSCDLVTGVWNKIDVDFPPLSNAKEYRQLVVSSGQMYMVKSQVNFTNLCKTEMVVLSIWKIVLETKEVVEVVKSRNIFYLSKSMFLIYKVSDTLVAVGCVDSIIILSKEGHCMKFDLLKKRWQELPGHTLDKGSASIFATSICACLVDI